MVCAVLLQTGEQVEGSGLATWSASRIVRPVEEAVVGNHMMRCRSSVWSVVPEFEAAVWRRACVVGSVVRDLVVGFVASSWRVLAILEAEVIAFRGEASTVAYS